MFRFIAFYRLLSVADISPFLFRQALRPATFSPGEGIWGARRFKLQFIEQENVRGVRTNGLELCKIILHIYRKTYKLFVIFSEKVLDIYEWGWYYYLARVGGICGFHRKNK